MRRRIAIAVLLVLSVNVTAFAASPATQPTGWQHEVATVITEQGKTERVNYLVYLPDSYRDEEPRPLVIYLHGAGGRGNDLNLLFNEGLPQAVKAGKYTNYILVAPQCPADEGWFTTRFDCLQPFFDHVRSRYRHDERRTYLTGYSMGGVATWMWAAERPGQFAAIVPVSCDGRQANPASLKDTPIWALHGVNDRVFDVNSAARVVDAVRQAGGAVRWTTYRDAGHSADSLAYNEPDLFCWLFDQKLKAVNAPAKN